jgi:iron complex transport system permease protein
VSPSWRIAGFCVLLLALVIGSFSVGRYPVSPGNLIGIAFTNLFHLHSGFSAVDRTILVQIRAPRILCGLLVGAGLAAAGAGYQTIFRNPLVSPDILGVSAGAGFGGALALLLQLPSGELELMAFVGGLLAAGLSLGIGRLVGAGSTVILVLAGVVVTSAFTALISVTEYLADPDNTLPAITFWLLGGLGRQELGGLAVPALIIAVSLGALLAVRWPLTVLSAGEKDAQTLGVSRTLVWGVVVCACTLITATTVSLAGIIGWVGLLMPHVARFFVGPSFGRLLIASALLGAGFVVAVDDVARAATSAEIPLGILTSLVGAPFFVVVLTRARRQWV